MSKKKRKRKMKPGGGKRKGSSYERTICKTLSLWMSDGKRDDLLWRSASSGARATQVKKNSGRTIIGVGDISSVHPDSAWLTEKFAIEVKHLRTLRVEEAVFGTTIGVVSHWKKIRKQAKDAGVAPMLIAKQNGKPPLVWLRPIVPVVKMFERCKLRYSLFANSRHAAIVVVLDDFLHMVTPVMLAEAVSAPHF